MTHVVVSVFFPLCIFFNEIVYSYGERSYCGQLRVQLLNDIKEFDMTSFVRLNEYGTELICFLTLIYKS